MKKVSVLMMIACMFLTGCANSQEMGSESISSAEDKTTEAVTESTVADAETDVEADAEQEEEGNIISPLEDTTMANLTDAILAVSFEEGDAYVDDTGIMQMDLKIYSYDMYDMTDIAELEVGDTLVRYSGEVEVTSLERNDTGTIYINGGLEMGGFDLVTDECGVFYESGYNDHKNWYEVGEATIRVSVDFQGVDNADLDQRDLILYPGSFLIGEVTNYNFTPYNTTIRVENGQVIELTRRYIP